MKYDSFIQSWLWNQCRLKAVATFLAMVQLEAAPVGGGGTVPTTKTVYVSALVGSDANSGTAASPLKTLKKGLSVCGQGDKVYVLPGIYDTVNGEVFPLTVNLGTSLIGDEASKGQGGISLPTIVRGYGTSIISGVGAAALVCGGANHIAGLRIECVADVPSTSVPPYAKGIALLSYPLAYPFAFGPLGGNSTVANCTVAKCGYGIFIQKYSSTLTGNNKILSNLVRRNKIGVVAGYNTSNTFQGNAINGNQNGVSIWPEALKNTAFVGDPCSLNTYVGNTYGNVSISEVNPDDFLYNKCP